MGVEACVRMGRSSGCEREYEGGDVEGARACTVKHLQSSIWRAIRTGTCACCTHLVRDGQLAVVAQPLQLGHRLPQGLRIHHVAVPDAMCVSTWAWLELHMCICACTGREGEVVGSVKS